MKYLLRLVNILNKVFNLSWRKKILMLEFFVISGLIRFGVLFIPFRKLASIAGNYNQESDDQLSEAQVNIVNELGWISEVVSRHTPWMSKCLVKALTTLLMLKRRKISSTVYLGVAKDQESNLVAHAWLRSGRIIVTGGQGAIKFTQVAKFASNVRREV